MIRLIQSGNDFYVSSKEVAEKFEKRHDNLLRDIDNLQVPENFRLLNFKETFEQDSQGIDRKVILLTRNGFAILAFGFTGKKAMNWKIQFLEAFVQMETTIKNKLPALEATVSELQAKIRELESKQFMQLPSEKKPHGNKGTVLVPVSVKTIFGDELQYHLVPKNSDQYSETSYKEGELKRFTQLMVGISKKVDQLSREVAILRRK